MIKTACVVAGFAVAALAATSAHAAKPLSVKQKNEMAEAMARNYNNKSKAPPKTAAKAAVTLKTSADGDSIEVPEELYNFLTASPDAGGNMRVHDTDGNGSAAPAAVEISDEN